MSLPRINLPISRIYLSFLIAILCKTDWNSSCWLPSLDSSIDIVVVDRNCLEAHHSSEQFAQQFVSARQLVAIILACMADGSIDLQIIARSSNPSTRDPPNKTFCLPWAQAIMIVIPFFLFALLLFFIYISQQCVPLINLSFVTWLYLSVVSLGSIDPLQWCGDWFRVVGCRWWGMEPQPLTFTAHSTVHCPLSVALFLINRMQNK